MQLTTDTVLVRMEVSPRSPIHELGVAMTARVSRGRQDGLIMNDKINERDEMLLRLRAEGHTYNEIARRLAQRYGRHLTTLAVYRRLQELAQRPMPTFTPETSLESDTEVAGESVETAFSSTPMLAEAGIEKPSDRPRERRVYRARQTDDGARVYREDGNELDPRFDLKEHSREGFAWAQAGPGAAQLALAILADYLEDDTRALALYQDFKWDIVAWLPTGEWELTSTRLARFLRPHAEFD
jgi:hypothetical protein